MMNRKSLMNPTLIGFSAILMWSTLALLTTLSGSVPPFQLTAMCFSIAFLLGVALWIKQGGNILHHLRLPYAAWMLGVIGLFGYHFFYFMALSHAPAVEASLIAYLWPLLIVLFSALLPGERLRWFHVAGAIAGFVGAALLVTKGEAFAFNLQYSLGYASALLCAVIWSSYSVLSRRFGSIPTNAVGGFCGVTAVLAWICHAVFETTVFPVGGEVLAILCLGIGPLGLAFFTWDYGVKHGNIKVLGALSYTAPLLSTLLLVVCGLATASWVLGIACLLIVGGAVLAAGDFLNKT
ncbi:EamA family transporter [Oscillatoria sp. FACHB-1407]|uniref:aromatic amino acid exporter YddG n=1 Tax=Oscillatoria sp. FACHB-1407 TaxID=2692847 RepID=UPI001686FE91|nr:EamA family transporter [Oscillatoria sp. FACHB-1407]MBD2459746.1 EamA family transporter [Oscillatoria sp. FACHB-1407]